MTRYAEVPCAAALVWERVVGPFVQRDSCFDSVDLELGLQTRPVRGLVLRVEVKVFEWERWAGGGITPLSLRAVVGELREVLIVGDSRMLTWDVVVFEVRKVGNQANSDFDTIFRGGGGSVVF